MGWLFGGWPPPPPALDTVTFAEVQAALAVASSAVDVNGQKITDLGAPTLPGDAATKAYVDAQVASIDFPEIQAALNAATGPVGFNGQLLQNVALPGADTDAANRGYVLDQHFIGFTKKQRTTTVVQTMTALGGTAVIPGPAAGFVRVLLIPFTSAADAVTALATTCVLNPGAFPLGTNATQNTLLNTVGTLVLGVGETLNLANNSAGAVQLSYSYYDVPDTGITLVRIRFSNTPVTIVPAPPAGFWRRILLVSGNQGTLQRGVQCAAVPYNCDSVSQRWGMFLGGTLLAYNSATISMSGNPSLVPEVGAATVTPATGALAIATLVAITTAQLTYVGAYETFPD